LAHIVLYCVRKYDFMKVLKPISLFIFCLLFYSHLRGQDIINTIPGALRTGNANALAKNFDKRVDITIDENADNYSSEQAEMILKSFLGKFSFREFSILHKGTSPDGAQYIIGSLKTNAGSYRTYIYIKKSDGVNYTQEIRFEKE
jgi:hypothetical protein